MSRYDDDEEDEENKTEKDTKPTPIRSFLDRRLFGWSVLQLAVMAIIITLFGVIITEIPADENPYILTKVIDATNRGDYTYVKVKEGIISTGNNECVLLKPDDTIQIYEYKYLLSENIHYKIVDCNLKEVKK